jgi:prefoldin subunit 5
MLHVETTPRGYSWRGRILRMALSAILLALLATPALAQGQVGQAKKSDDAGKNKDSIRAIVEFEDDPASDLDKLRAELKKLEIELQKKKAESQQLQAQMEATRARLAQAEKSGTGKGAGLELRIVEDKKAGPPPEITLRFVDGAWKIVESAKDQQKPTILRGVIEGGGGIRIENTPPPAPQPPPVASRPGTAALFFPPKQVPPLPTTPDARIDNLEKKLDKVMQMIEQMRRDMEGSRKKAEAPTAPADIERAARDAAEGAEIRALRIREAAVQQEIDRVELLKRALQEAGQKKLVPPAPEPPKQ